MSAARAWIPRADGGLLLVAFLLGTALVAAWPGRPEVANASWDLVAPLRTVAFAAWGWAVGIDLASRERTPEGGLRGAVARLAAAGAVTAGVEAVAHAAQVAPAPFAWNAAVAPAIAVGGCGVAFALLRLLARVGAPWAALLVLPALAAGLVGLDLWAGVALFTPWLLPAAPSPLAAVTVFGPALVTVVAAARGGFRGATGDPAADGGRA